MKILEWDMKYFIITALNPDLFSLGIMLVILLDIYYWHLSVQGYDSQIRICASSVKSMKSDCGSQEQSGGVCIRKCRRGNVVLLSKDYVVCEVSVTLICMTAANAGAWLLSWKKEQEPKIVGVCPAEREWGVCLNIVLCWLGLWIGGNCRSLWDDSSA